VEGSADAISNIEPPVPGGAIMNPVTVRRLLCEKPPNLTGSGAFPVVAGQDLNLRALGYERPDLHLSRAVSTVIADAIARIHQAVRATASHTFRSGHHRLDHRSGHHPAGPKRSGAPLVLIAVGSIPHDSHHANLVASPLGLGGINAWWFAGVLYDHVFGRPPGR
jgi:hypothetical protein